MIGPNGSGKTSLVRHVVGVLPSREAVEVGGAWVESLSARERARRVSYVPQAKGDAPPFDVGEFVLMGRRPYLPLFGKPGKRDVEAAALALETVGMAGFSGRRLSTLSGGERQLVYVAAALAQDTPAVVLDEPTLSLDPAHAARVDDLAVRLHREMGKTVLMVTHDVNVAVRHAGRVLGLCGGKVAFWGTPEDLVRQDALKRLFGIRFIPYHSGGDTLSPPVWMPSCGVTR